jgi:poly(3-hydroxybutyrate) depolymerase
MRYRLAVVAIGLGMALAALSRSIVPAHGAELNQKLWDTSFVVVKGTALKPMVDPEVQTFLTNTKPRGVYLFLHGSGGVNKEEVRAVARAAVKLGYVVIAPDYYRNYSGWSSNWATSNHRQFSRRRASETLDLVDYVKTLPWVDKDRIVIHGQSAGAQILADFNWGGFAAAIFTGFNCAADMQTTIDFPKTIPVLSMQDPNDPTFGINRTKHPTFGTCKSELRDRPNSYVLEMPGVGHKSLYRPEAVAEITKFLTERGLTK